MAAPLTTLLAAEPEIQYVALRNIDFILQKHPSLFSSNIRGFFCKFGDPIYVKMEKVEVLIKVADGNNVDMVLNELKEYTNDIDAELVSCAVKAIGHIILKVEKGSRRAVEIIKEIAANGTGTAL